MITLAKFEAYANSKRTNRSVRNYAGFVIRHQLYRCAPEIHALIFCASVGDDAAAAAAMDEASLSVDEAAAAAVGHAIERVRHTVSAAGGLVHFMKDVRALVRAGIAPRDATKSAAAAAAAFAS